MNTLFKLFLVLFFCYAVSCERNFGFQIDSIGVAVQKNIAPYIKLNQGGNIYNVVLDAFYEIYFDNATNTWLKDFSTETDLDSLSWNITTSFANGYFELMGVPCPCLYNTPDVEPFPGTRNIGRQVRDESLDNSDCNSANFHYFRLLFQDIALNKTNCTSSPDITQCSTNCTNLCQNSTNTTNCNVGCGAITNSSSIDTNDCYTACTPLGVNGTADPTCIDACMGMVDCIYSLSCPLNVDYHLHKYVWANTTNPAPRKLVFAFEIIPQPANMSCGCEFVNWYPGPFLLWINTTTLSVFHPDCGDCESCSGYCPVDLSSAVVVNTGVYFAPTDSSVIGRMYADPFTTGNTLFNSMGDMSMMQMGSSSK